MTDTTTAKRALPITDDLPRQVTPTGFDGEVIGGFYGDDDLDRRCAALADEFGRNFADFASTVSGAAGHWARVRPILDELAARGDRRRWVLEVNPRAVADVQRAHVDAMLAELDEDGSTGWREDTVTGMLASLAGDTAIEPEARERYQRLLEAMTA